MRISRRLIGHFVCALSLSAVVTAAQSPNSSPVADAASRGDVEAVRALLKQGVGAGAPQGDGMTALHWAAERGDATMAEMLLVSGASTSAGTRVGHYQPLHLASRNGHAAVVKALLKAGADPMARAEYGSVTPLHLAAESGNVEAVTALLDKGADVNALETEWDQTPLIFATENDRVAAMQVLIKRGAKVDLRTKSIDLQKQSAVDRQAQQLQKRILDATVPKGELPSPSQLQSAIEAMRELYVTGKMAEAPAAAPAAGGAGAPGGGRGGRGGAAGANPFQDPAAGAAGQQAPGDPPADRGNVNAEAVAPVVSAKGGLSALHHAARQGYVDATRALLDAGATIDEKTADGHSALMVALINGQFDVSMELIKRGANPNLASDGHGVTPLWAAINTKWQPRTRFPQPQEMELQKADYLQVMTALLDKGADVNARIRVHPWYMVYTDCGNANCGLSNAAGATAFWRAAYGTDVDAMRLLAKYGADPNIPTMAPRAAGGRGGAGGAGGAGGGGGRGGGGAAVPAGDTPALPPAAAAGGRAGGPSGDQSGLPPVPYGGPGVFPLHAAAGAEYGEGFAGNAHRHAPDAWLAAVKYLVEEMHADVNARDNDGYTPLHHAAARGDNEMILYLVSKGADPKLVSRNGRTTVDMANGPVSRISPFPSTIALLEKMGVKNNHMCQSC